MNITDTVWALTEVFGDRREILDGLCFIVFMPVGFFIVLAFWS